MTTPPETKCTCLHTFELRGERECRKHPNTRERIEEKPDFHMMALAKSECAKNAGELTVVRLGYVTQLLEEVYATHHSELDQPKPIEIPVKGTKIDCKEHGANQIVIKDGAGWCGECLKKSELEQDKK